MSSIKDGIYAFFKYEDSEKGFRNLNFNSEFWSEMIKISLEFYQTET
jgi:hypothetical protein